MNLYNKFGKPIAYLYTDKNIYLFSGKPVGYLDKRAIYAFEGEQIGWFNDGWVRDLSGKCVFFTYNVVSHTIPLPAKEKEPNRLSRKVIPIKARKKPSEVRFLTTSAWSLYFNERFFNK